MSMQQNRKNLEETMKLTQKQNKVPNLMTLGQPEEPVSQSYLLKLKLQVQGQTVTLEVDPNISGYSLRQQIASHSSL